MRPEPILQQTAHRQYPPPERPWVMQQRWHDLLFAHWPLPPDIVRRIIPAPLELDLYEGTAWIGVIPFTMSGVRLRGMPALPRISAFPELNVRTYVRYGDRAGVYFFSLDAGSRIAVTAARRWYRLPYHCAAMTSRRRDGEIEYRSRRTHRGAAPAELVIRYRPTGRSDPPPLESLDHWLVERYRLLTVARGRVIVAEIHHPAWRLAPAAADIRVNTMTAGLGVALPDVEPQLAFAAGQEVLVWRPTTA